MRPTVPSPDVADSSACPARTTQESKRDSSESFRSLLALAIIVLTLIVSAAIVGLQQRSPSQKPTVSSLKPSGNPPFHTFPYDFGGFQTLILIGESIKGFLVDAFWRALLFDVRMNHFLRASVQNFLCHFLQTRSPRLPTNLRPLHYDLEIQIHPDPSVRTYTGLVRLFVTCLEATFSIQLHAAPTVRVFNVQMSEGVVTRIYRDGDMVKLTADRQLKPFQRYQLTLHFDGRLGIEDKGFYTDHVSEGDRARVVYVTQFEPNHARRAFPCFDEPAFKSAYRVTLAHAPHLKARSNMPLLHTEARSDGLAADVFSPTPEMSSYAVAWLVSDLVSRTQGRVTVWGEKHQVPAMGRALAAAVRSLEYCERFFHLKYALPKLDMVGIEKFSYAGMENWGLIVLNERYLFGHDDYGPSIEVITHEIFHQWLGDLVTIRWWTDIWVQEAPTYYLSRLAAEVLEPNQGNILHLLSDVFSDVHAKYERPALFPENSTKGYQESQDLDKAMHFAVHTRTHQLIRMIHFLLGDDEFRACLKALIMKYRYKNLNGYEFLQTMTEVQETEPKVDLQSHMQSWFESDGFPLVTIRRDYRERTISIKQEPFNNFQGHKFHIPLIREDNRTQNILQPLRYDAMFWLTEQYVQLPDPWDNETTLMLNPGMIGYFVVNYDARNWALIGQYLARTPASANVFTVAHLLRSSERLYEMRKSNIETVLWTWEALRNVTDWEPWSLVLSSMINHDAYLAGFKDYERYQERLLQTLDVIAKSQTFNPTNESKSERRDFISTLRNFLCDLDYDECVQCVNGSWKTSYEDFERRSKDAVDARPETVLCLVVRHGDQETWDAVLSWRDHADAMEKVAIDVALTCSKNESSVKRAISESLERGADWTTLIKRMPRQGHLFQRTFLETILALDDSRLQKLGKWAEGAFTIGALYVADEDVQEQLEAKMERTFEKATEHARAAARVLSKRAIDEAGLRRWLANELPPAD